MNIRPGTLTLIPGKPAAFVVSLTPLNGFASAVLLSAGGLPAGITAGGQFSGRRARRDRATTTGEFDL
jgi:hypothetical protein